MRGGGGEGAGLALQPAVEPGGDQGVAVETGVAQRPVARAEVRPQAAEGAVVVRSDDDILVLGRLAVLGGGTGVVEQLHVRADGDVVPAVEPQRRHAPAHVVVIQAPFAPGRIIRRPRDQRLEGRRRLAQVLHHLVDGQVADLAGPVHVRLLGVQVVVADDPGAGFLIDIAGDLGPLRIVHAVQPDEEQVAGHAARVPVALFLEPADLADAGAGRLGHHGGVGRVVLGGQGQLPLGRGGTAQGADLAVRPGLGRDPGQGVIAVGLGIAQDLVIALREVAAAFVLHHQGVAPADPGQGAARRAGVVGQFVIGRSDEDGGQGALGALGPIDVGRQAHPVPHRNHHRHLDIGDAGQFGLGRRVAVAVVVLGRGGDGGG